MTEHSLNYPSVFLQSIKFSCSNTWSSCFQSKLDLEKFEEMTEIKDFDNAKRDSVLHIKRTDNIFFK